MKNQPGMAVAAARLCAEWREDDSIDPCHSLKKSRSKASCKAMQLSKAVQRIISLVLGETRQPLLHDLQVDSVMPDRYGQSLLVTVGYYGNAPEMSADAVMAALHSVQGLLRSALAQALNRKRIPLLRFRYVGAVAQGGCDAD